MTEIALAGVLGAGTIQLWRHHRALATQDLGFRAESVLTFRVTVPVPGQTPRGAVGARLEDLRQEIEQLQAVEAVGAATNLPWSGYDENADLTVLGREVPKGMDTVDPLPGRHRRLRRGRRAAPRARTHLRRREGRRWASR